MALSREESELLRDFERFIKRVIPRQSVPGFGGEIVAYKPANGTGDKPKRRRRRRSASRRRAAA